MPPFSSFTQGETDGDNFQSSLMTSGFTSNLMETIVVSRSKVNQWVEHEKAKADAASESYRQRLKQEQAVIDSQAAELLTIQLEMGMKIKDSISGRGENADDAERRSNNGDDIATKKQALEHEITKLQIEVLKLQTERDNRERRVKDISIEESKHRLRANDARLLKEQAEEAKRTTVDDLTRGVINYKYLGLEFHKHSDKETGLRFSFTQLDADDPSRQFSFVLLVDEEEKYDIVDCNPEIDAKELMETLRDMNQTEDMPLLVRRMRRAFQKTFS